MTRKASLLPGLAALALAIGITACNQDSAPGTVHAQGQSTAEAAVPTAEGVLRRCEERWAKIVAAGEDSAIWVEIYEYETPAQKKELSLPKFLDNKSDFIYVSPTKPRLLLMEDDFAFVDISAKWLAGRHPMIGSADVGGDQDMVEPMDMIEQWQWVNGEWHFMKTFSKKQFFRDDPDFLARAQAASSK